MEPPLAVLEFASRSTSPAFHVWPIPGNDDPLPPIAGRGANAVECLGAPAEIRIGDSDIAEVVGSLRGSRCGASEISLLDRTRHRFARLADCRPNHREVVFSVPAHIGATPLGKTGIGSLTHSELSNLWRPKADQ
jgi:hypothetical protein